MDLLERDRPLAMIREHWQQVADGGGAVVLVTGEAGLGKTALVTRFLDGLAPDQRVFVGACEDFSIAEPLGPLSDIGRQVGWSLPDEFSSKSINRTVFVEALEALAPKGHPTLIVIEDLHWADDATLDFLRFAGRRLRDRSLLLIVTSRDTADEGQSQIRRAFADVPPGCLTRIPLAPLSETSVRVLFAGTQKDPAQIYRTTQGNPFFIKELLVSGDHTLPPSIQDAVLVRADRLDRPARALLDAVSIFPRRARIATVSAVMGGDVRSALDPCLSHGLLQIDDDQLSFRHELARLAVEAALPWSERTAFHRRALDHLRQQPGTAKSELLHHARRSDDQGDVHALATEAAREAQRLGSNREAAEYYWVAIETAGDLLYSELADLCERSAWSYYMIGRFSRAIEVQKRALGLLEASNDPIRLGDGFRKLSRYQWTGSATRAETGRSAAKAVEILADFPSAELAMAHSNLAQVKMLKWEFSEAIPFAEKAIEYARAHDHKQILSHAYNNLACSLSWTEADRIRDLFTKSIALATEMENWDDAERGYVNWSEGEYHRQEYDRACELADLGLALCEEHQLDGFLRYLSGIKSWSLLNLGRWDEARAAAEVGMSSFADGELGQFRVPASIAFAQLMSRTGRGKDPQVSIEIERASRWIGELQHHWAFATMLAERAWLGLDDETSALAHLEEVLRLAPEPRVIPDVLVWLQRLRPEKRFAGIATLPEPQRHLLEGDWQGAAELWARKLAPYEQALALANGDADACSQALEILADLGAETTANRVRADMQRRGIASVPRGPRQSTKANPKGLTRRQMDVLALLEQGLSNAEIAEKLFVSPKTIDHHVSAILAKLDVTTRGQAASVARSEGIVGKG